MNYRHAYHAGNFADVVKHVILARTLTYLKLKPSPFCVIDTHAGAGRYDLSGTEAGKTGEWRDGIGRLIGADAPPEVASLLAPYLETVAAVNAGANGALAVYPGSPLIAQALLRPGDRLSANELHAEDAAHLKSALRSGGKAAMLGMDGYQMLKGALPPRERRGVVLIDPPFEQTDEFGNLAKAISVALKRFATGIYIVWYPVKNVAAADRFVAAILETGVRHLDVRLAVCAPFPGLGLTETGTLVINPPFALRSELDVLMPYLEGLLADGAGASSRLSASV